MGITFVQKSDLSKRRPNAKRALVLAGGAISGGSFKLGGLAAFDRYLTNLKVTDFDIYMGTSAGAFLAAPIAAGVAPEELVAAVVGDPGRITRFKYTDFYQLNWRELALRPAALLRDALTAGPSLALHLLRAAPKALPTLRKPARDFLADPGLETAEALLLPFLLAASEHASRNQRAYLPSGLFDNARIEAYIRSNLERNGMPNTFRQLKLDHGKSLYITATNINTAQGVIFGHDEDNSVTISEAVQASTAIPGFFKPARVGLAGREQDFVDGSVRKTANISTAVRHGAELLICYNPFRPFVNYRHRLVTNERSSIADLGMAVVINQSFRTLLHSRLRLGIEKLRLDETFRGDVILIEPAETDSRFFAMNPLAFWHRGAAAEHGFQSVKASLAKHDHTLRKILGAYGIEADIDAIGDALRPGAPEAELIAGEVTPARPRPHLRVVGGDE
ncbi:MAG: patatin-like phospholipase family protein [Deltaproteobacteria bacterium]|nr:patatin-like phospholipase family protein [Deltaproteobacteria bacterium]